jgi:hypothetical protein
MYESTFVEWRRGPLSPTARIPFFSPGDRGNYMSPEYRAARLREKKRDDDKVAQLIAAHRPPEPEEPVEDKPVPAEATETVAPPAEPDTTAAATDNEPEPPPGYMFVEIAVLDAMRRAIAAVISRFPEAEALLRSFNPEPQPSPA